VACDALLGRNAAGGRKSFMSTVVVDTRQIHIPPWVQDFASFRHWANSDEFPENGRVCYIRGEVWVDMSKEQFRHNQIKGEVAAVLGRLVKEERLGRFFPDGYLLTDPPTNLSTNPDGIFVSTGAFQNTRVQLVAGVDEGHVELEGPADMVLEVVSPSSVHKDQVVLRELYWQAGVREYWLVDAREGKLDFQVLRGGSRGYVSARKQSGWAKSMVFGRAFRLTEQTDRLGLADFTLHIR
jgi:Uma2 family endonuclease